MKQNQYDLRPNTLYHGDCLEVMQHWQTRQDAFVDLIYLDPPFNSKADYNILYGKDTSGAPRDERSQFTAFKDTWYWSVEAAERIRNMNRAIGHPAHKAIRGLTEMLPQGGMLAYLSYMAERLVIMHSILKDTGSLYLHCDPSASHYLKMILDCIFGAESFRNEIIWCYHGPGSPKMRQFNRKTDTIFWYSKGPTWTFNKDDVRIPYRDPKQNPRKAYDTGDSFSPENIAKMREKGKVPENWWVMRIAARSKKEYLGYPTQKPLALLERIVTASSNPGDLVLDPFCGCGTTAEAAYNLKRQFLGIDISPYAVTRVCRERMKNAEGVAVQGLPQDLETAAELAKHKPLVFEHWAVSCMKGFMPNDKQSGDGGVDGRGYLVHQPVAQDGTELPKLCCAQVKGGKVTPDAIRALVSQISGGYACVGVMVTLQRVKPTPTITQAIADAGNYSEQGGVDIYPRLLFWSVEDYFAGVKPELPNMAHPLTGKAIAQSDMFADD